jgi:hypothetical protein
MSDALQQPFARRQSSLWVESFQQPGVWRRAILVGLPVGILQAVINQGDRWWHLSIDHAVVAKTIISLLVTFSVALISVAATYIERKRGETLEGVAAPDQFGIPIRSVIENKKSLFENQRTYDRIEI